MSPKVRLLALVGLVAAFALGGGLLLLSKQGSSSAATPKIHPLYAHKRHHVRTRKTAAVHNSRATRKKHSVARHALATHKVVARRSPRAHVARRHRSLGPAVVDGMPAALAYALQSHRVVVVSLVAPRSSVDQIAFAEARAGAAAAGAGFVPINVMDDGQSHALTTFLAGFPDQADRLLDDPAVLIFQQPKDLFVRLNGFADRDTVAQAVQNALSSSAASASASGG